MSQQYTTFQQLFKSTDEYFGLTKPLPVIQHSTAIFDVIEQENENEETKNSKVKLESPQIEQLKTIISRVKSEKQRETTIVGKYLHDSENRTKADEVHLDRQTLLEVNSNWEEEVSKMMECDAADGEVSDNEDGDKKSAKLPSIVSPAAGNNKHSLSVDLSVFKPKQRLLDSDITAFDCFESEYVTDLSTVGHDPLDVLIPNTDRVNDENEDDEEGENNTLTASGTTSSATGSGTSSSKSNGTATASTASKAAVGSTTALKSTTSRASLAASAPPVVEPIIYDEDPYYQKSEILRRQKLEKVQRIKGVDIGFNAAASIEQNALMGKRPRDYLPSHRTRVRSLIAALNHSTIATTHKNTKPDLTALELKYFHRPHMLREKDRPWQISCKNTSLKKSSLNSGLGGVGSATPSHLHSSPSRHGSSASAVARISYTETDKQNLSLAHNKVNFILLEYIEEIPPMMLNYGMASAIFNYYRTPKSTDEDDERRTKARLETEKLYDSVLGASNRCRLPRHVMLLLQLRGNHKPQYEYDINNVPRVSLGDTKVIAADDESPFLGTIEEGEIQQAFVNNLFKAPIFRHAPHATDFLLIRTKLQQKVMNYSIRTIPYVYLAGQMEPQKVVPRPVPRITSLQEKFYMLAAARFLQANFDGADYADIQRSILKYVLRDKAAPHKSQHKAKFKDILKKVGEEFRDTVTGELKWYAKEQDDEAAAAVSHSNNNSNELDFKHTAEEIAKSFSPEEVCLQESCNAAEYRLFHQHISDIDLSKVEAWLTLMHKVKQGKLDRAQRVRRMLNDSSVKASLAHLKPSLDALNKILVRDIQRLDNKMNVARYIFNQLVIAPWNTTEAFVHSHLERDGQGKMELLGIGDPSGCGEGFAYVRILKNVFGPGGTVAKKSTVKLVSTDKDLRKLTKKDAIGLLVGFGVSHADALKLKRWDRVHMIREMSTMAEKSGVAKDLHKYARGDAVNKSTITGVGALESFGEKAQRIWDRQKAALSRSHAPPAAGAVTTSGSGQKLITDTSTATSSSSTAMDVVVTADGTAAADTTVAATSAAVNGSDEDEDDDDDDDEDFALDIERTLNARAAASATMEANESARVEKERKEIEEEKKEFSSIKSFMTGMGQQSGASVGGASVSGSAAATTTNTHLKTNVQGGGGGVSAQVTPAAGTGVSGGSNPTTPRRKVTIENSAGGANAQVSGAASALSTSSGTATVAAAPAVQWTRPRRVVKRVICTVDAEGIETVRVEFLFSGKEVDRVEYENAKAKKERDMRRSGQAHSAAASNEGGLAEEDFDDAHVGSTMASMSLNIGKMKKAVDRSNQAIKREKNRNYADLDEGNIYANKLLGKTSSKRSHAVTQINLRLPRVSLAARLEKELCDLWTTKNAHFFHYPVNRFDVPGYYEKITNPISMSDIRSRIAGLKYETASAMVADFELMARNAATFNQATSFIAVTAKKLVDKLRTSLNHEAVHFGPERDTIRIMEEAIAKKNTQFRRGGGGGIYLPQQSQQQQQHMTASANTTKPAAGSGNQHTSSKVLPTQQQYSMGPPSTSTVAAGGGASKAQPTLVTSSSSNGGGGGGGGGGSGGGAAVTSSLRDTNSLLNMSMQNVRAGAAAGGAAADEEQDGDDDDDDVMDADDDGMFY